MIGASLYPGLGEVWDLMHIETLYTYCIYMCLFLSLYEPMVKLETQRVNGANP